MAKLLYEYWFVQFDFPDENGKPYKSSGGEMVYSPELKRQIPKGWEVKSLRNCIDLNYKRKKVSTKDNLIDLSVMPKNSFILNQVNSNSTAKTNLYELSQYDILFGSIRPYLKKAGFSVFNGTVIGTIHQFKSKKDLFNFLLCTLTTNTFLKYAVDNCEGTKMPIIKEQKILNFQIPFNKDIINYFEHIFSFKEIIANNIIQNQKLASLRDWLLPILYVNERTGYF